MKTLGLMIAILIGITPFAVTMVILGEMPRNLTNGNILAWSLSAISIYCFYSGIHLGILFREWFNSHIK